MAHRLHPARRLVVDEPRPRARRPRCISAKAASQLALAPEQLAERACGAPAPGPPLARVRADLPVLGDLGRGDSSKASSSTRASSVRPERRERDAPRVVALRAREQAVAAPARAPQGSASQRPKRIITCIRRRHEAVDRTAAFSAMNVLGHVALELGAPRRDRHLLAALHHRGVGEHVDVVGVVERCRSRASCATREVGPVGGDGALVGVGQRRRSGRRARRCAMACAAGAPSRGRASRARRSAASARPSRGRPLRRMWMKKWQAPAWLGVAAPARARAPRRPPRSRPLGSPVVRPSSPTAAASSATRRTASATSGSSGYARHTSLHRAA